jgi:hypothetical protein
VVAGTGLALAEWRGRLHAMTNHLKRQAAHYRAALRRTSRDPPRNRLLLAMACSITRGACRRSRAALETDAEPAAAATYAALAPVVASAGTASYYPNVHRDWVWGDAENQAAVAAVRLALGSERPEEIAGARQRRRTAPYDLHALLRPTGRRSRHQSAADAVARAGCTPLSA